MPMPKLLIHKHPNQMAMKPSLLWSGQTKEANIIHYVKRASHDRKSNKFEKEMEGISAT
jgi:hypothetical protein